jgi:hypothetical protein
MAERSALRASWKLFGVSDRRVKMSLAIRPADLLIEVHLRHGERRQRSVPPRLSCRHHRAVVFNHLRVKGDRVARHERSHERRAMNVYGADAPRQDVVGHVQAPRASEVEQRQGELPHRLEHERIGIHRLLGKVAAERGILSGEMTAAANRERREIDGVDRVEEQHWGAVRKQPFEFCASNSHGRAGIVGQDWILVEPAVQFCERMRRHGSFLPRSWGPGNSRMRDVIRRILDRWPAADPPVNLRKVSSVRWSGGTAKLNSC